MSLPIILEWNPLGPILDQLTTILDQITPVAFDWWCWKYATSLRVIDNHWAKLINAVWLMRGRLTGLRQYKGSCIWYIQLHGNQPPRCGELARAWTLVWFLFMFLHASSQSQESCAAAASSHWLLAWRPMSRNHARVHVRENSPHCGGCFPPSYI